ncbi:MULTISPECIES: DUF4091 domain-containing protein [Anaeromyxobacter]|uniref:DUF4091 domain-containing protein n=1 Tax=Anaeromyxobacter TaxID=161492 RepID=UPI001F57EBC7|nr:MULTISPECIES: glycoside hydrolase domain-containing protein [unclassified Anaeromyxobacter]
MTSHGSRSRALASCALLILALLPAHARAAPAAKIWVASATEKIRPGDPARATSVARISAARNEFEAFQVVVTGNARGVRASASTLSGPGGAVIAGVRLYREALINLTRPSAPDGATGRFPDALVPDVDEIVGERRNAFPFDVRGGESRAIWVEVFVPRGAAPGLYRGELRVDASGRSTVVPVELTVWDFELPSTSTLRTAFGLMWGTLPAGHGISASDVAAFATLRARYGQLALDHRLSLSRHDDGQWNDLDHFDRYYRPLMDGTAPTRLAGARLTAVEYLGNLEDVANLARWATRYRSRPGWFERLFQYTCDEPPYQGCTFADVLTRARAAKTADREFRTLVTTTIQQADANGISPVLDLLVPVVNFMDDKSGTYAGNQRSKYDPFLAADPLNEVWLYQSCMSHGCGSSSAYDTGWPSYMIDASAVRNRAMQWLDFVYRATGELYWDTTYAYLSGDPWTSQWEFDGNGDGTLFYPGTPAKIGGATHVPVASIRLKMIREGMEDYEYLSLLSRLGDPGLAAAVASDLFPTASSTDPGVARLMAARERVARRILELRGVPLP